MTASPVPDLPTRRPTLDDLPGLLALVEASDLAAIGKVDFTAEDAREALTTPGTDPSRDSWVALDADGMIVGWTYARNETGRDRDFIEVFVWPERGRSALRPLLAMMLDRVAERAVEFGHELYTVRAGAVPTEKEYVAALTEAGFVFCRQHARMRMSLDGVSDVPPPAPAGVLIRTVRPGDETDLRRFHAVIEEAFQGTDHASSDYPTWRRQIEREPTTTWGEWLVAETGGDIVGVLQSADGEPDEGWVRRLAVAPAHQQRGIGEALLRRVFAIYVGNGRRRAGLGVDMANPTRAVRLYLGVGMTPLYQADIYQKTVTGQISGEDVRVGRLRNS